MLAFFAVKALETGGRAPVQNNIQRSFETKPVDVYSKFFFKFYLNVQTDSHLFSLRRNIGAILQIGNVPTPTPNIVRPFSIENIASIPENIVMYPCGKLFFMESKRKHKFHSGTIYLSDN